MTAASALAERFHRARTGFEQAMEAGCSIIELRRRRAADRAWLRQRAGEAVATGDLIDDVSFGNRVSHDPADWSCGHMMRD